MKRLCRHGASYVHKTLSVRVRISLITPSLGSKTMGVVCIVSEREI